MSSAKTKGMWVTQDYEPGDVLIFDWEKDGKANHTGILEKLEGTTFHTIEGNTAVGNDSNGGCVMRRTRAKSTIMGAVRPDFTGTKPVTPSSSGVTTPASQTYPCKGWTGDEVKEIQKALIAKGYSCGTSGVDGDFGSATDAAVKQFQQDNGLTVDGIVGPKTQEKLFATVSKYETGTYKVNTPNGIIKRNGAGTDNTRIGKVLNGEIIEVTEIKCVENNWWGKISDGWVCLEYKCEIYVEKVVSQESSEGSGLYVITTTNGVKIRSGAGTSNSEVGNVAKDEIVTVTATQKEGNNLWGKIEKGWICLNFGGTSYAEIAKYTPGTYKVTISSQTLTIRKTPATSGDYVDKLQNGTIVNVSNIKLVSGNWWGEIANGWICLEYNGTSYVTKQ